MYVTAKESIPTNLQHLIFAGKELEDMHNLHQYEIQNHSIPQLVLRLVRQGLDGLIHTEGPGRCLARNRGLGTAVL